MLDGNAEEAVRQLVDMGYGGLPDATVADAEQMIANELAAAYALVKEVSFQPAVTDLFLMKADVHNLKVLLKLRLTGSKETPVLLPSGVYSVEALSHMVEAGEYKQLPPAFQEALDALEQSFQVRVDPARISTALDSAYIQHAYASKLPAQVRDYFKALADFDNVLTLLRARQMQADPDRVRSPAAAPGGYPPSRPTGRPGSAGGGLGPAGGHRPRPAGYPQGPGRAAKGRGHRPHGAGTGQLPDGPVPERPVRQRFRGPPAGLSVGQGAGGRLHPPDHYGEAERAAG